MLVNSSNKSAARPFGKVLKITFMKTTIWSLSFQNFSYEKYEVSCTQQALLQLKYAELYIIT